MRTNYVVQPVVATKIQQQSSDGFALDKVFELISSVEQPVVAKTIQQQSSWTACLAAKESLVDTACANVEQPVVATTIQQQSSSELLEAFWLAVTVAASVEQPVVATTIQQQSF